MLYTPEETKKLLSDYRNYTFNLKDLLANTLDYILQLEREKAALLEIMKEVDIYNKCCNCVHYKETALKDCDAVDCECFRCEKECACKTCEGGSNWEWKGVQGGVNPDNAQE